jgi:hypothetical protein
VNEPTPPEMKQGDMYYIDKCGKLMLIPFTTGQVLEITDMGPTIIDPEYKRPGKNSIVIMVNRGDVLFSSKSYDMVKVKAKVGDSFKLTKVEL